MVSVEDRFDLLLNQLGMNNINSQKLNDIKAPMPGLVAELNVSVGTKVNEGDPLLTLEAMKMYTTVSAPHSGTIESIELKSGENVDTGDLLMIIA